MLKTLVLILLFPLAALAQGFTITPLNPVATPGGSTITFSCVVGAGSCSGGTGWSCTGCQSSINPATGVLTPPATAVACQSFGGYQLLPCAHVFNTRIDSLPTRSDSNTLITGAGTVPVNYLASFPINFVNASTPTTPMLFFVNPGNNANFQCPQWPDVNIETGWFDAIAGNDANHDHHCITVDTTNGNVGEQYQFYAQATVTSCTITSNVAVCTFTPNHISDGFKGAAALGLTTLRIGSFTGGDSYLNNNFSLSSATGTTFTFSITHANATTSTTGQASVGSCASCNSQAGVQYTNNTFALPSNFATDAASMFLAPLTLHTQELVNACANGTAITHALRMTLQPGFIGLNTFIWPATAGVADGGTIPLGMRFRLKAGFAIGGFSACAQKLLTQMKNYGLILADGGTGWQIQVEDDNIPAAVTTVLAEINNASIATSNWEVVDESGIEESSSSGAVNTVEYVCFNSSSGTACTNVAVNGTAISVPPHNHQYYVTAGTPQKTLPFFSAAGAITCGMSPSVGSLTSDCKYTPPATSASYQTTTVTATSSVNGAVTAQMIVYVSPDPLTSATRHIQRTTDYTDSHGNLWYSGTFTGSNIGVGMASIPSWQGSSQFDGSFPNITDKALWQVKLCSSVSCGTDFKIDLHVPNGAYQITYNLGTDSYSVGNTSSFYVNGNLVASVDVVAAAGGAHLPYTLTTSATVSNNILSFYGMPDISSISFALLPSPPGVTAPPKPGVIIGRTRHRGRHRNYELGFLK